MTLEERQKIADEIKQHQYKWMKSMEVANMETFNEFLAEFVPDDDAVWIGKPALWLNELTLFQNFEVINEFWSKEIENRSSTTWKADKDYVAVVSPEYAVYVLIGSFSVTDNEGNNSGDIPMTGTTVYVKKKDKWKVLHCHYSWQTD